MFFFSNKHRW